jgi:hypothetical protein
MLGESTPVLHEKVLAPLADKVAEVPAHTVVCVCEMLRLGDATTFTVTTFDAPLSDAETQLVFRRM